MEQLGFLRFSLQLMQELLRDYKGFKVGLKRKRKKAALSTCYIEVVLAACAAPVFRSENKSDLANI